MDLEALNTIANAFRKYGVVNPISSVERREGRVFVEGDESFSFPEKLLDDDSGIFFCYRMAVAMHRFEKNREKYNTISVDDLADWIESQGDVWWSADTDPKLDSLMDYQPVIGRVFAGALRRAGHEVLYIMTFEGEVNPHQLDEMADRDTYGGREFFCKWPGQKEGWILAEEIPTTHEMLRKI